MIITSESTHFSEGTNLGQTTGFKINANSKAFELLGDKLYSDKIGSTIRELSSNALDSHRAKGNPDQPFDIHLPTLIEPFFSIRDYGTGLSDANIRNIYATYFESTKNESNEYIGGFGLGSKTPFSVVNMFTVKSYQNGELRIYSAHKTDNGPSLTQFTFEDGKTFVPTAEPDGLEVSFAVDSNQQREWERKVKEQLAFFKVKPNISGDHEIIFPTLVKIIETDTWFVANKQDHYGTSFNIILDSVKYSLSFDEMMGNASEDLINVFNRMKKYPFDYYISMPIGSVNVSVSRESLSYDKHTKESLIARIMSVSDELEIEIEKYIKDKIVDYSTEWDGLVAYYKTAKEEYRGKTIKSHFGIEKFITVNGKQLDRKYLSVITPTVKQAIMDFISKNNLPHKNWWEAKELFYENYNSVDLTYNKQIRNSGLYVKQIADRLGFAITFINSERSNDQPMTFPAVYELSYKSYISGSASTELDNGVDLIEKTIVVHLDKKKFGMPKFNEYARDNKTNMFIINGTEEFAKTFAEEIGCKTVVKASDIITIEVSDRATFKEHDTQYRWSNYASGKTYASHWEHTSVDIDAGGLYVPVSNYNPDIPAYLTEKITGINSFDTLMRLMAEIISPKILIGVKHNSQKFFAAHPKWTNVFDYVKDYLTQNQKTFDKNNKWVIYKHFGGEDKLTEMIRISKSQFKTNVEHFCDPVLKDTILHGLQYHEERHNKDYKNLESFSSLCYYYGIKDKKQNNLYSYGNLNKKYKLLPTILSTMRYSSGTSEEWKHLTEYLNMVHKYEMEKVNE